MALESYKLDKHAHELVLKYRDKDILNETHKMRMTVAYGLERFWAEQFRLEKDENQYKAQYWRDTWQTLAYIMKQAKVIVPNDDVNSRNIKQIKEMAKKLWTISDQNLEPEETQKKEEQRKVILAVLTQLCDCMVWWAQRYKGK